VKKTRLQKKEIEKKNTKSIKFIFQEFLIVYINQNFIIKIKLKLTNLFMNDQNLYKII
jgi:hypothetical protein